MKSAFVKTAPGIDLNAKELMDQAERETGLSDFGDPWFREPLEALVHYINLEAGLQSKDARPVRHMINMLCDRLRLADYLKRHPKVHDEKIEVVGIILGQARGGSTLTQRLTAQCPQLTTTYFWELFAPVPQPGEKAGDPSARIKIGDDEVASWSKAMPEYKGIHPLNSSYFEEEIWLMDRGFDSYMYNIHFNVPGYYEWTRKYDHTKAIEELVLWFKLLQYNMPERRSKKWLCKNQHYPMNCMLRELLKAFPKANLIQTHRSMDQALSSLCSVQSTHIRASGSTTFDPKEIGPRVIYQYLITVNHMMEVHNEMPHRFVDVQYKDLVSKPIETFRHIIEGIGLECGEADIKAATDWMSKNGRGTHPPHNYKPEDYGVSAQQLKDTFKFYHDKFLK
jgi:hypothetical protein